QMLQSVLNGDRAGHRHHHRCNDRRVAPGMAPHIMPHEPDWMRAHGLGPGSMVPDVLTGLNLANTVPHFCRNCLHFTRSRECLTQKTRRFFATFPSYNEIVIKHGLCISQVSVKPSWLLVNS